MPKVKIEIIKQKGECSFGHKEGDVYFYADKETVPHICPGAWYVLYRDIYGLLHGANYPWDNEGEAHVACPDPFNPVTFKITRMESEEK